MRKAISLFAFIALTAFTSTAQDSKESGKALEIKKPSRDFVMIQLHHDGWNNSSGTDLGVAGFGRGMSAYLCYDFPIGQKEKSHFSFAAGLGFSANNIYFKHTIPNLRGTTDSLSFIAADSSWKGIKYNTAYLEMPLELRFFGNKDNRNKGIKVALGAKIGLLVGSHTKYSEPISGTYVINKEAAKKFNQTWRLAPTFRIGYGNFSVFAQYSVTGLFNQNKGPEVHPFSIGLTITGL